MPAGSVLICRGGMLHGAGQNSSRDSWRHGAQRSRHTNTSGSSDSSAVPLFCFIISAAVHRALNPTQPCPAGIFASFTLGWLRQEENLYIDCPPEIARSWPPELSTLVGYDAHGALGFYDAEALAARGVPESEKGEGVVLVDQRSRRMGDGAGISFSGRL
eukprot:SAG22_NODE_487_length_9870_cov_13.118821_8_plen_160_part_00